MSSVLSAVFHYKLGVQHFHGKIWVGVERWIVCVQYFRFEGGWTEQW